MGRIMPLSRIFEIIEMLELETEFTLTNSQYKSKIGLHIPIFAL